MSERKITETEILNRVYNATDHEALMSAYRDWADQYDSDLLDRFGYVAHVATAKALHEALGGSTDARILDAGCGTGLVGEELVKLGYRHIDALDYSADMLAQAARKGIYGERMQADMKHRLPVDDDAYDAVVCTGTFTYGHVTGDAFDELVRIVRPGGVIVFTIREGAYEEYGYRRRMLDLETAGAWELVSFYDTPYQLEEGNTCKMCSYRVPYRA
ncbi:class I SAM-dependent DNA methyltransferase [Spiribacter insolitus]|uniref:Class I SAM-dependent methyltransferase n=1 Tax=Spiribacter insolitus TaxID=3122417 RepID=A0ABV3T574_9GAMM